MVNAQFCVSEFVSREKPWDYMVESGLCEPDAQISEQQLSVLRDSLDQMDEVHLAFAMVIAENSFPHLFAHDAARFLSHSSLSVRVNAYRVIRAIPSDLLSTDIEQAVVDGLSTCPEKDEFSDALVR